MTIKSRTRRPFASVVVTGSSLVLLALMLPACGFETEGVFESPSGSGGNTGGSSSGGEGGATSSSGQGGATTSSSGQGGNGGGQGGVGGQGGSAGQTSSSSGGPVDPEDCLDGIDNDKDGAVDCADDDCAVGFTCTDAPPDGWSSVALERGMGAPPGATPCDNGATPEVLFAGPAGAAECTACTCGDLMGTTCNPPALTCYVGSQGCNFGQQNWTDDFPNGDCAKPDIGLAGSLSCRLTGPASVAEPGSCAPSKSDFPNKDTWMGWVQSCAVKTGTGGCAAGTVCAPKPGPTQSLCIRQDGQNACPAGWATVVEAYVDAKDDRACADCSCAAAPTCTGGTYEVFDLDGCAAGGSSNPVAIDNNTCRNVSGQLDSDSWSVKRNPPTAGGNCTPAGGEPLGSVQPTGPVTFCCK